MPAAHPSTLSEKAAMRAMFAARKQVFIDLLKWDLPVLAGRYEVDQFDTQAARYLIHLSDQGAHRASARLLPTTEPHLLDTLFPQLCTGMAPSGPHIWEITRFCLDRHLTASERRRARDQLVSALVDHALAERITTYTGVAELKWYEQLSRFGWECARLGEPLRCAAGWLTALEIAIADDTVERVRARGIYVEAGTVRSLRSAPLETVA